MKMIVNNLNQYLSLFQATFSDNSPQITHNINPHILFTTLIDKNHIKSSMASKPNLQKKTLFISLILVVLINLAQSGDFCVTNKPHDVIALSGSQNVMLTLGDYVRGFNLKFETDQPTNAQVLNPLSLATEVQYNFGQNYKVIDADVFQSPDKKWLQQGVIFAQKDSKTVSVIRTKFTGTRTISTQFLTPEEYTLPEEATCFSATVVDSSYNVVIDCQTKGKVGQGMSDLTCFLKDQHIKCSTLDSLNEVKDRKAQMFYVQGNPYLIVGTYSKGKSDTFDMTFLTIYRVNVDVGTVQFANIIDGYQLGLGYDIIISDFDILPTGQLIIHDSSKHQLLYVTYTLPNELILDDKWVYGSQGTEIQVSDINTILIATKTFVEEWDLVARFRVFRYELEKGDNQIVDLAVNTYGVVVETTQKQLYVYQRIMSPSNYLVAIVDVSNKDYLMSPYANVLYVFNDNKYEIYEVTSGTLSLKNFPSPINVTVTAHSSSVSCKFTIQVLLSDSPSKIISKQNITKKHFQLESDQTISLNLEDIYSGQFLTYEIPKSTEQIVYSLEHLETYTITSTLGDLNPQIVNINKTAYMALGVSTDVVKAQICIVNDNALTITCTQAFSTNPISHTTPSLLTGKQRKSTQIVFAWVYNQNPRPSTGILRYTDGKFQYQETWQSNLYSTFSSIVIGEDRIFYTAKRFNQIYIIKDLVPNFQFLSITKDNFVTSTAQLVGFYPRDVFVHPRNSELFYIKFQKHVCLMTFIGIAPKTVECIKILNEIVDDSQWTMVMGTQTVLFVTPKGITEYSVMGNEDSILHTVAMSIKLPVNYNTFLNTVTLLTEDSKIVYYKLNKAYIDAFYFQTSLTNQLSNLGDGLPFSSQGYWTISPQSGHAYRQSYTTKLSIQVLGDHKSLKQDIQFSIKVKGVQQQIDTSNNITIIKYPTNITITNQTNDVVTLPSSTDQIIKVPIIPDKYFLGPRSSYHIVCDYCDNQITLETAFKNYRENKEIIGAKSMVQVQDNLTVVLTNNRLNLIDNQTKLITYKVIENVKQCTQLTYQKRWGLVVFCEDLTGDDTNRQEIITFEIIMANETIVQKNKYAIPTQALIKTAADEIVISQIDNNTAWLFIEDNRISQVKETLTKYANVKAFKLTDTALQFKAILTSESFGLPQYQPINDIHITNDRFIVASVGNTGLGYATLSNESSLPNILVTPQIIYLHDIPEIQRYLLDDSIFQQVQLLTVNATDSWCDVLVTSTTSLSMVVRFTIAQNSTLQYSKVTELYNRYGTFSTINWHFATETLLLLAYHNSAYNQQYIVYYNRSTSTSSNATMVNDFSQSFTINISQSQLAQHSVYLTSANILIGSTITANTTDAKLFLYELSPHYNLVLNYTEEGDFNNITITSTNYFSSNSYVIDVEWEHDNNPSNNGIKWYTVMIIILIVLIIVGVAYGMYLKMIKHRKDKKVSLLTEGEEVDQVV